MGLADQPDGGRKENHSNGNDEVVWPGDVLSEVRIPLRNSTASNTATTSSSLNVTITLTGARNQQPPDEFID